MTEGVVGVRTGDFFLRLLEEESGEGGGNREEEPLGGGGEGGKIHKAKAKLRRGPAPKPKELSSLPSSY